MFTQLHLQNFKGWADTGSLRLAPITVLFGSNSSGKTSLLQSILLLKQTAESSDRSRVLHTGDDNTLVDVGTLSDVIFGHDLTGTLEITLAWRLPKPIEIPGQRPEEIRFTLQVRLTPEGQPFVQLARYHMDRAYVVLERRADDTGYDLKSLPSLKRKQGRPWALPPPVRFYGFPDEVRNYFQKADWLADLALELEHQLARVHYVGPLRQYAKRSYLWSGERPLDVGTLGELAVPAILAAQAGKWRIGHGTGQGKRYESFVQVIARWLKQLGVIDSFRVEAISKHRKDYEVRVKRSPKSAEVLITDVGVGVSQVLPVVVQCFYAAPGSTVIFEQPEIHLHPRVQADLADVLIEASTLNGVQFIVESHSEHFLRRLQRRVAEETITKDHMALYVCDVVDGRSRIDALGVDELGNIINWPKDFFGDEIGDLAAMTEAAMKRRKKVVTSPLVVVDTNVPIAANGHEEISPDCVLACEAALLEVLQDRQRLVLDDNWRIIGEYKHKLSPLGQPRLGNLFLKWVLSNWANPERCDLVAITARDEAAGDFEEFPGGLGLEAFDPSDRKFVAVSNAHAEKPPILQALDSKWWGWKEALSSAGITVEFLCPSEVKETYERKFAAARHD